MSSALREPGVAEPVSRPQLSLLPRARRLPGPRILLAGIYVVALAYHWLQSRAHVSPAVFGDELLYSKLAQSIASGEGFSVRGETVLFPAPFAVLLQAPAWLFDSTPTAYAVAKAVNAAVMTAAAFPAYCLARRVVRPAYALLAAAMAVTGPAMLYAPYLMSEALAYPVFLVVLATMLRAIDRPSRRMEAAVVAVSMAAVLTRTQFVVVPLAYLLAVPVAARLRGEPLRIVLGRHRFSLGALGIALPLAAAAALLGTYGGAAHLDYDLAAALAWSARTAALLPFASGLLVIPGALLGLVLLAHRPKTRAESALAALTIAVSALVLLEAGLISAADAGRELERYAIYLLPLVAVAFFAYAERGAPWRRAYTALALAGAATAWLMPFPASAGTAFSFDSPTLSAYGQAAASWGHANAASLFAGVPLVGGIVLASISLRRRHAPAAVGFATIATLLLTGAAAYLGDHAMTRGTLADRAGDPPDWLDRSQLGPADYLQLPGGSAHYGWVLEAWNRDFRRPVHLGRGGDWFAESHASIEPDGRLLVDGRQAAGTLVVNDFGTAIELDGEVVVRPRAGLTVYRLAPNPRVRMLAEGLMFDRWAAGIVTVRSWPQSRGLYVIRLTLPAGHGERTVTLSTAREKRVVELAAGTSRTVQIHADGALRIETNVTHLLGAGTADARLVGVRIPTLGYSRKP